MKMERKTIKDVILEEHDVSKALGMLRGRMEALGITSELSSMDEVEADYRLMCECVVKGMRDPNGSDVYADLLRRIYVLYGSARLASVVKKRLSFIRCAEQARNIDCSPSAERQKLESFVQDAALASLSITGGEDSSLYKIYELHQGYLNRLFGSIVVSPIWSDETAIIYEQTLLSPTIDQSDAQVMVSAIMLALLNVFDVNKWLTLVRVYMKAEVQELRQRALVGWALTMPRREADLFPAIKKVLADVCRSDETRRELLELQMQLFLSLQTDADNEEIQRDIMPVIMKNSDLKLTRNGFVEKDDNIDDILGNDSSDKKITEMEEKMRKMMDMKKSGSDIYFGGFSHMKRFAFFYQLSNWFAPFSMEHPDLASAIAGVNRKFIEKAVAHGPFCSSDKYSFVLALSSVVHKLPESVREVMESGSGIVDSALESDADRFAPTYVRRMYLQDLYRFFNLHMDKSDFFNPFEESEAYFFLANPLLYRLLDANSYVELERFLFRNRRFALVAEIVSNRSETIGHLNEEEAALWAKSCMRMGEYVRAYDIFSTVVGSDCQNRALLVGLADTAFILRHYDEALVVYDRLVALGFNSERLVLNRCLALINCGRVRDGMPTLFRLDYENPDNHDVKRIIGWGYLVEGNAADALRVLQPVVKREPTNDTDFLNCGYAEWALCHNDAAVEHFLLFLKKRGATSVEVLKSEFESDGNVLERNGIKDYEVKIMLDIVKERLL